MERGGEGMNNGFLEELLKKRKPWQSESKKQEKEKEKETTRGFMASSPLLTFGTPDVLALVY